MPLYNTPAAPTLQTMPLSMVSTYALNVRQNTAIWGGVLVVPSNCVINNMRVFCTTTGTGYIQGGIYTVSDNTLIGTTSQLTIPGNGLLNASFALPIALTKNVDYYVGMVCTATAARFGGMGRVLPEPPSYAEPHTARGLLAQRA